MLRRVDLSGPCACANSAIIGSARAWMLSFLRAMATTLLATFSRSASSFDWVSMAMVFGSESNSATSASAGRGLGADDGVFIRGGGFEEGCDCGDHVPRADGADNFGAFGGATGGHSVEEFGIDGLAGHVVEGVSGGGLFGDVLALRLGFADFEEHGNVEGIADFCEGGVGGESDVLIGVGCGDGDCFLAAFVALIDECANDPWLGVGRGFVHGDEQLVQHLRRVVQG